MKPEQPRISARLVLSILCECILIFSLTSCVKQERRAPSANTQMAQQSFVDNTSLVNINTASREELEKLPGIGEALALRIIEHRERHGRFRRPEHVIMVRGLSDRRFRELSSLIVVE